MPVDPRHRLEMIQGSEWTRHRVTYITLLIDKEVRGWRHARYKVVKLGIWQATSEVSVQPGSGSCTSTKWNEEVVQTHQSKLGFTMGLKANSHKKGKHRALSRLA